MPGEPTVTMFKDFLNSLLPVAEELGDKEANVVIQYVDRDQKLDIQLVTRFVDGKVVREVTIEIPDGK